jgi:hypothetical protein
MSRFRSLTPGRLHVLEAVARSGKHVIGAECGNSRRKQADQRSPTCSRPPPRNGGSCVGAKPASMTQSITA